MTRIFFTIAFVILTGKLISQPIGKVDCSGVKEFWKIFNELKKDHEPDSLSWDQLFETPGYAEIQKRERKRSIITKAFRLAFKPSLKAQLDTFIVKDDYLAWMLRHLIQVPGKEDELKKYQEFIEKDFLLKGALQKVNEFIDTTVTNKYEPPPISAIIFAADGRGYSNRIVFDMLHVMLKKNHDEFFAHEYFHFFYGKVARSLKDSDEEDEPLTSRLYYMAEEGLTDMNDKRQVPFMNSTELAAIDPDGYLSRYKESYLRSEEIIKRINETLEQIYNEAASKKVLAQQLNKEVPMEGRPTGAYMANAILENLGVTGFNKAMLNVFDFYRLYNIAAKKSNKPMLSEKSISLLTQLEHKYLDK